MSDMAVPFSVNVRTFWVVQSDCMPPWPIYPAQAIFETEDSAHEFLSAIDVDGLKILRVAVRIEAGYGEEIKGWPR